MRKVTLIFQNMNLLTAFVLEQRIRGLEVKSSELKVSGTLTEKQIITVCTKYKAELIKLRQIFQYQDN